VEEGVSPQAIPSPINPLVVSGIVLVFLGFLLIFLGFFLGFMGGKGRVEGGGVVIVGPFPIVFASSERMAKALMVIALVFFALVVALYLLILWFAKRTVG